MDTKISMNITQTHINTLQNIISRHASYSLNCKTWCITIVSALGVILFEKRQCINIVVILFPVIVFFLLDCYYLGLERLFKDIYEDFLYKLKTNTVSVNSAPPYGVRRPGIHFGNILIYRRVT
jgi:hypothetical protein